MQSVERRNQFTQLGRQHLLADPGEGPMQIGESLHPIASLPQDHQRPAPLDHPQRELGLAIGVVVAGLKGCVLLHGYPRRLVHFEVPTC